MNSAERHTLTVELGAGVTPTDRAKLIWAVGTVAKALQQMVTDYEIPCRPRGTPPMTTPMIPADLDDDQRFDLSASLQRVLDLAGSQELPQDRAIATKVSELVACLNSPCASPGS